MDYLDQYVSLPPLQPSFQLQPPTPVTSSNQQDSFRSTFVIPSQSTSSSSATPVPIPISRPTSRGGTPASSLSRSASRHHPYSTSSSSYASSFSERALRPRSATSASDRSDWDSEASAYETDYEARFNGSPEALTFPLFDIPFPAGEPSLPSPPDLPRVDSPYTAAKPPRLGKNGKPTKSHARRTAPGHIKRPPNAFILFRSHCCAPKADPSEPDPPGTAHARHLASLDINNSQHVSVIVSQLWRGLAPEDKAYWDQKAQEAKEEHQRLHPEYRYKPQQRSKEGGRKRKQVTAEDDEHRNACNEVARLVLAQERSNPSSPASTRSRTQRRGVGTEEGDLPMPPTSSGGLMDEVLSRGTSAPSKTKTKSSKAKAKNPRKSKAKKADSSDSSPASLRLPTPPPHCDPSSRPSTAPFPSVLAGSNFSPPRATYGNGPTSESDGSQFAFMAQLDREATPFGSSFPIDPQFGMVTSSIDGPAPHPLSRPATGFPTSRPGTGVQSQAPSPHPPATAPSSTSPLFRPPSPTTLAIQQMQSYSLGGPSPPANSPPSLPPLAKQPSNGFTFGTYTPPTGENVPLAQRRDVQFPPNLPLSALKHRRSTIRAGQLDASGRGDLMLISPLTTTFNGRRQSLGWSSGLRRISLGGANSLPGQQGDENAPTTNYRKSSLSTGISASTDIFETYSFPQDVLDSLPVENPFDYDALTHFASSVLPTPEEEQDGSRPDTATSAWSMDEGYDTNERLDGGGFPAGYFDRRRSTLIASKYNSPEHGSPYHVGSTTFFNAPAPVLSSPSSHSPSPPSVPAFGSAEFGGSFEPFAHRQSFGSLLATSLAGFNQDATPTVPSNDPSNQFSNQEAWSTTPATASSMRDTALSVLHERQGQSTSPQAEGQHQQPQPECEYVFLPLEQLDNVELMAKLHQQGYGIAFEAAPLPENSQLASSQKQSSFDGLASGQTMPIDESLLPSPAY